MIDIEPLLTSKKQKGKGWMAKCPAHADGSASLSVDPGKNGGWVLKCFAGCTNESVCEALGITLADLMPEKLPQKVAEVSTGPGELVCSYPYHDSAGVIRYVVDRYNPKTFRQRKANGERNMDGVERVLYRLPNILKAKANGFPILVTEGEKDAETLAKLNFHSTCNAGGAGKWLDSYTETLRGADVVIVPDNDPPGLKHAELVASKLRGIAKSVKTITVPTGKDVTDYINGGATVDDIASLIDAAEEMKEPEPFRARSLWDLQRRVENDPTEILKDGFLNIGGGLLWVAPTGTGKSVAESQAAILWGAGMPTFGIRPVRPLRSLIIQGEDDDGDRAEMRDGIIGGLNLTPNQIHLAKSNVFIHHESSKTGLAFFTEVVTPLLREHKPDLLWINPLFSFLGGDASDQALMSKFLRNWLNPLLQEHRCAGVVIHHTNKPPKGKEKGEWSAGDFAYLGSGSAEMANWARAVLAIRSIGSHDVFSLYAGKRGKRLRWVDENGAPTMQRLIGHSNKAGLMFWRDVEQSEIEAKQPKAKTDDDLMALVPTERKIEKAILIEKARANDIGRDKAKLFISELIEAERLFEMKEKAPGRRDLVYISRYRHETAQS